LKKRTDLPEETSMRDAMTAKSRKGKRRREKRKRE